MSEEQALSVRSLVESDLGPLRRFTGVLDSTPRETKTYGEGADARESVQISLNFKDLEVIESIEPYNFPIYTVTLTLSNRKKSKYGVFGVSLANVLDRQYSAEQLNPSSPEYVKPQDREDLPDCIGRRIGMVLADSSKDNPTGRPEKHLLFDGRAKDEANPKGQDVPTACWEVYSVEGIAEEGEGGLSAIERAMELLDGKTLANFNKDALADDKIRSDSDLLSSIGLPISAPNSFANTLVAGKQFWKDKDGVYHKGEAPVAPVIAVKGKK